MWLDDLYPKKCVGCGKKGKYFCDECLMSAESIAFMADDSAAVKELGGLVSLFRYQGVVRKGIIKLKYRWLKSMEDELSDLVEMKIRQIKGEMYSDWEEFVSKKPRVTPIPLHKNRENWRGFNQAEMLAKIVARSLKLEMDNCLIRVKKTKQQADLGREERLKNVDKVFKVSPPKADAFRRVKRILLIDDVWTTGSTMKSAARVLRKNGVKEVWGLVLAQANF